MKRSRMRVRENDPSQVGNSRYAKKIRAKFGRGTVDPRWMWWTEGSKPRPVG